MVLSTIALISAFFYLSLKMHWSDSELWVISLAKLGITGAEYSIRYKPLFYGLLSQIYHFDLSNTATLDAARILFATIGVSICWWIWFISRSWFAILLFASSTYFLSQGFRVRSDILACALQMACVGLFLSAQKHPQRSLILLGAAALHFMLLASTPKAAYNLFANLIFYTIYARSSDSWQKNQDFVLASVVPAITALAYFLLKGDLHYKSALFFFFNSFGDQIYHPGFLSAKSFMHVRRFAIENFFLLLLFAFSICILIRQRHGLSHQGRALVAAGLTSLIFIFFHNDRLPFFIVSMLPFPILMIHQGVQLWTLQQPKNGLKLIFFCSVLLVTNAGYHTWKATTLSNNDVQRTAISIIEEYLSDYPGVRYYDPSAILPRNNEIFAWPAPEHEGNRQLVLQTLRDPSISLVFFANRLFLLGHEAYQILLEEGFVDLGSGVYGRHKTGEPPFKPIEFPENKKFYQIFDFDPNF